MECEICFIQYRVIIKCLRLDEITELINNTDITIIPTMNPDGFDRGTEGACSGIYDACCQYVQLCHHFQVRITKQEDTMREIKT